MMRKALLALLGALAGYLLFGAAGALGAGAVLVNLFTPLPAAVLGVRLGPWWGTVTVGLTAVAVLATSGGMSGLLYLVQFGLPAALLPWLMSRGVSWDRAVATTLGLILVLGMLVLIGVSAGSGQTPLEFVDTLIDREIDQAVTLMEEFAGAEKTPEAEEAFRQLSAGMGEFMRRAYPGMLVVVCAALQLVTVGLLAFIVRPAALPGLPFARWHAPELLIWALIAAGFTVFFASGAVQTVALNLLVMVLPAYCLQGLAVVEHYLVNKGLSPLLRGLSYLFLLLVNPLPMVVTGIGVFDLWVDFRKPRLNKDQD